MGPESKDEDMSVEDSMFISNTGTVSVRLDGSELFLGLSVGSDPNQADPDLCIQLTKRQGHALRSELDYWLKKTQEEL